MNLISGRIGPLLITLLAVSLSGCAGEIIEAGNKAKQRKENFENLKQLGRAYFAFHDRTSHGPKSWEDLQGVGLDPGLRDRLSADGYTVVLGVDIKDMTIGTSNFLLAYPQNAAQEGGQVCMADGSVFQLTAEEFKQRWTDQQAILTQAGAVIIEPEAPAGGSAGAGVISVPANSSSSGPPLPPKPPSP